MDGCKAPCRVWDAGERARKKQIDVLSIPRYLLLDFKGTGQHIHHTKRNIEKRGLLAGKKKIS